MWESISIAWMGTLIAAIFAVPLSFLAAENLVGRPDRLDHPPGAQPAAGDPRDHPRPGVHPGLRADADGRGAGDRVGSIGTLGKLFYEIIEGIKDEPIEAADAVGATRLQRLRWGVLPQVTPELASLILYRFEVNIRASAVLGVVGAGGIGGDLQQALLFKDFGTAGLG